MRRTRQNLPTSLVSRKTDSLTHNLCEKDETELTHIVGEQEDRFTPPTDLVRRTRENSPTYLVSRKTDSLTHNLDEKDERELIHIVGEQEDRDTPPTILVGRTRENSPTLLVSRKSWSLGKRKKKSPLAWKVSQPVLSIRAAM